MFMEDKSVNVAHLLAVAATVLEYGGDEDLAIAALLHDSAKDQDGRNRFGERVATADTAKGEAKADWRERKEGYLAHLQKADEDILRVSLADKVHNARAILRDLRKPDVGEEIWAALHQPKEETLWYYRSLTDRFAKDCAANCLKSCVKLSKCWRDIGDDVFPCTVV